MAKLVWKLSLIELSSFMTALGIGAMTAAAAAAAAAADKVTE